MQEKFMHMLKFNFRSWISVNRPPDNPALARAHDPNENQQLVSDNLKSVISMIYKVESAIWSHNIG